MPIHNKNSLFLSLAGGALMIVAGVSGAIGVIGELSEVLQYFYGLEFFTTFESFMQGLAMWAGLGGFVVVIGGLILTTEKVRFGRMIILAGVTVGVVGLLMTLVQMASTGVFVMEMFEQLQQSVGWIGAIMAYIGRIVAEQKPILDRE
ncbi:MAG: hypothetical protein ACXAAO_15430 [Candidatus Thorarchaeota archaeon]|jgi:hypothetical protein